jgi:hypothetical protein
VGGGVDPDGLQASAPGDQLSGKASNRLALTTRSR